MNRRQLFEGCSDFMRSMIEGSNMNYSFTENADEEMLVVVFLRGGYDGLNFLAPVDDTHYLSARGENVRINSAGKTQGLPIKQNFHDGDFRLHHTAGPIKELYDDKKLAFVHASGLKNGTRSHFVAQELIEKGTEKEKGLKTGWLARHIGTFSGNKVATYAIGNNQPEALLSANKVLSLTKISDLKVNWNKEVEAMMASQYGKGNSLIHKQGTEAMNMLDYLNEKSSAVHIDKESLNKKKKKKGGNYNKIAVELETLESVIKMDVGLKVATINVGGWDTHDNQQARYTGNMKKLSTALAGFYNRLHAYHGRLNIVVMSEFGRRVKGNNNGGTDHGYGNVMWALGGNVNGGEVYGKWPGLANEQLDKGVDLSITTDYRMVLSEVMTKRMKQNDLATIFPKFDYDNPLGVFKR
ncbi:MAG: DUF1501 domain-containing protein [Cyclobacteriaceae bacterium]